MELRNFTQVMNEPKKLKRVVIKEEFVALTGSIEKAVILNQLIYWSERIRDFDKFIKVENTRKEKHGIVEIEDLRHQHGYGLERRAL